MAAPLLTSGITEMMSKLSTIDDDESAPSSNTKVVKLRFTRKQYDVFRDACKIFEIVSSHPDFLEFVKNALEADVKIQTIPKQLIKPIVEAPTRIPMKVPRAADAPRKESYFTKSQDATKNVLSLHSQVKDVLKEGELKQDIGAKLTCITDVRIMVSRYITKKNLKTDEGTELDNFLSRIAPKAILENRDILKRVGSKYVIPKGDRKVITGIVNEIIFGK